MFFQVDDTFHLAGMCQGVRMNQVRIEVCLPFDLGFMNASGCIVSVCVNIFGYRVHVVLGGIN